jgi:hypothetical protein
MGSDHGIKAILGMLENCSTQKTNLPPTILYNEGWMLRLILDWFANHIDCDHELAFSPNCIWYSEALLPSAFLPAYRGDKLAESWTHADGAIGHFDIGKNNTGELSLKSDAAHLVIVEAKMFSKLSSGVTHARYYNQAARNVACIAEVLKRANRKPEHFSHLGFYVIAPEERLVPLNEPTFKEYTTENSIMNTVRQRVEEYKTTRYYSEKQEWFDDWFTPVLQKIKVDMIRWEDVISFIRERTPDDGDELDKFYNLCIKYNRLTPEKSNPE